MPELPEVETVARQLEPHLRGRILRKITFHDAKLRFRDPRSAYAKTVRDVFRAGKQVVIELAGPGGGRTLWLSVHLRMTGRLFWSETGAAPAGRPPRAVLVFDRGALFFHDVRRFGVMRLYLSRDEIQPAGLDPMEPGFTARKLGGLLSGCRQEIKPWLMRQDRLCGLGNIYASEILFSSRIHPERSAGSLSVAEIRLLRSSTLRILRRAIDNCGVTFSDFQDSKGDVGAYQQYLRVYGRAQEPCRRCRTPIARLVQQQRATFFCPECQQ